MGSSRQNSTTLRLDLRSRHLSRDWIRSEKSNKSQVKVKFCRNLQANPQAISPCSKSDPLLTPNKYDIPVFSLSVEKRFFSVTVRKTGSAITSQRYSSSACPSFHPHVSKCQYSCNASNLCFFCLVNSDSGKGGGGGEGDFCFRNLASWKEAGKVKVCFVGEEAAVYKETIPVTGTVK